MPLTENPFATFLTAFRNSLGKLPREEKETLIAALAAYDKTLSGEPCAEFEEIYVTLCDTLCE